jgi:phosphate-selective porin OprO and OprP
VPVISSPLPADPSKPVTGNPPVAASASREEMLEARVRQLEAIVAKLSTQMENAGPDTKASAATRALPDNYPNATGPPFPPTGPAANPPPSDRFEMPLRPDDIKTFGRFGFGFEWRSYDEEYVLQFHDLTQVDYRGNQQGGQNPVHDTFVIPRQWFIFSGRLQKPYEYYVSIQNSFDTVNMLDVFGNVHYDDRFQFKFGRYKTPFAYEFYVEPTQAVIQPEFSLFFENFGANRQLGAQLWGQLFNRKLDWAAGIFNQTRNSYVDLSDGKEFLAFLNWKPFGDWIDHPLENLNLGGSVMFADAGSTVPIPNSLRTQVSTAGNAVLGIPFLNFNNNTREIGTRALWDAHLAYFYKGLSLISEFGGGYQSYALSSNLSQRTKVPVDSFYVQAGYFITGETVAGRGLVKPLRDFDIRPGRMGPGAVELTARYNNLVMGNQVFTAGFADPNQNARGLYMTDVGVNWYWTQQIKWYFDWEHAVFGTPVVFAPGRSQLTSDTFWARFQIYF